MGAGRHDLTIEQGATFRRTFTWKDAAGTPVNLTGYTAAMQVRTSPNAPAPLIALTDGAGITLGGAAGTIAVLMTDEQTDALPHGKWKWDLKLTSPAGEDTRLLEGAVSVPAAVTR